jgi:hypothetical protein
VKGWASVLLCFAIALATGCAHRVRTYPYGWQLYGAVTSASETLFQVRHKTGHRVDLVIDEQTVFTKNKQPASWRALLPGSRVTIDVETDQDGLNHARRVQISGGGRT